MSDDTISTFSCAGDLLPDEPTSTALIEVAGTDNEYVAVKRIAKVLARRRGVDPEDLMPKLLGLFENTAPSRAEGIVEGAPPATENCLVNGKAGGMGPPLQKQASLLAKASGFFQKLKPQTSIEASAPVGRRFSFEFGGGDDVDGDDDKNVGDAKAGSATAERHPAQETDRMLRRSASMTSLADLAQRAARVERTLSPVTQSPTSSAPTSEPRRCSRIPTPVRGPGCLARSRQERENASSSVSTNPKHPGRILAGCVTAPVYSSPTQIRHVTHYHPPRLAATGDRTPTTQVARLSEGHSLPNHCQMLHGNAFATAAAAQSASSRNMFCLHDGEDQPRLLKGTQSRSLRTSTSDALKENVQPLTAVEHTRDTEASFATKPEAQRDLVAAAGNYDPVF